MAEMKAAVMTSLGHIEMKNVPKPEKAAPGKAIVKVEYVGICGSDLHYFEHGKIGDYIVDYPFILGHESGGVVTEVGEGVTNLKVGDRVALEPGVTCGKCEFCKTGRYNLCPDVEFFATPPFDGTFVEYVEHPADMCFKLSDNVSTMEGALIEPLAVGLHAANQVNAQIGQNAVVLGSGCIGLVTLMSLKAKGVSPVYVVDVIDKRLEMAKKLGADVVINAAKENTVDAIMKLTDGAGVDLVCETAGSKVTTQSTVELVKRGGDIVLVGMSPDSVLPYDIGTLMNKEATLHTVFRYRNLYPVAIAAVASGAIPLKDMVTNVFEFDDTQHAMSYNCENKADVVKAVIKVAD